MDNAARQTMMEVLSDVLARLVEANDQQEQRPAITKFHALRPPSISILDYLSRILRYANCSGECFVLALVYIDRLIRHQNFVICGLNIHRVIVTSITLAAKFFDDAFYNNVYYAKIGGVPVRELNSLELEFLFLINFTLHVSPLDYYRYQTELCEHARRTGKYAEDVLPHCDVPEEELVISETDEELLSDSEAPPLPEPRGCHGAGGGAVAPAVPPSGDRVEGRASSREPPLPVPAPAHPHHHHHHHHLAADSDSKTAAAAVHRPTSRAR